MIKHWLKAFRPRTLPLSLSTIWAGSFLAVFYNTHNWAITGLATLTTVFLQVLSNLANDYGDFSHGTDNASRVGPARSVQSGEISPQNMKKAIAVFSLLSLGSGIALLAAASGHLPLKTGLTFFVLGILCIAAAIKYTAGKNPYGYSGFGDLAVFIFFGLVGTGGSFYLHAGFSPLPIWTIAASFGFLSTGVLNLNNLRDLIPDQQHGKKTMAVMLGEKRARIYHLLLIVLAMAGMLYFALGHFLLWQQWLFLLAFPLFVYHLVAFSKAKSPSELDPLLKQLALSTLALSLLFGTGMVLAG